MDERVVRIRMPSGVIASAIIGMTAYFASDQRNQEKLSEPAEPIPVAGSQPSSTAKTITRITPSQKLGTLMPSTAIAVEIRSRKPPMRVAARMPRPSAMAKARTTEITAIGTVLASARVTSPSTGPVGLDGDAEIAGHRVAEPDQVLDWDRLVQAIGMLQFGDVLGGRVRRQQALHRIAGRQVNQRKADDSHPDADRYRH